MREHFVFWQVNSSVVRNVNNLETNYNSQQYKESDEAVRYMTFYKISDWPYIAIIDPRTGRALLFLYFPTPKLTITTPGENMVTWSKIDSSTFPELITEFLSLHPR